MKPAKPRLTARITHGLEAIYALAHVNKFDGSDLYVGADKNGIEEINDAIDFLSALIEWKQAAAKPARRK